MEQKWDFMKQPIKLLESIVSNYDSFCDVAEQLEWLDIHVWHDDYGNNNPFGVHFNAIEFPEEYLIIYSIADAYVLAILSDTAFYKKWYSFFYDVYPCKGWNRDFWDIPCDQRKNYLIEGRTLYEGLATMKEPLFIMRDWAYLASEIKFFAGVDNITTISKYAKYLNQFENAKVIEIDGCKRVYDVYLAMKRNRMLLVTCGYWQ